MSRLDKFRVLLDDEQSQSAPSEEQPNPAHLLAPASPLYNRDDALALAQWSAAIIATAMALWLSRGTAFHQLAIGVLGSLICIFVGLSLVEIASRLVFAVRSHPAPRRRRRGAI